MMFVNTTHDAWRFDIPLRGVDPQHVTLDVAGHTIRVRVEEPDADRLGAARGYEQALAVPRCLDLDRLTTSYRDGLLRVTIPLEEADARRQPSSGVVDEDALTAA